MKLLLRTFEVLVTLAVILCEPPAAAAQQATKPPRLGWLANYSRTYPPYDGFRDALRELGYAEGQNLTIEARWADGDLDRLPELAKELVRLNVDVLFVGGDQGLRAAEQATETIPMVVFACDPLDRFLLSLARPSGNATGLTCISSDLAGKRLELLKEVVPSLSRVAVLYNPDDRNKAPEYGATEDAARKLHVTAQAFEVRQAGALEAAFTGMVEQRAQALVILADPLMNANWQQLADLALKNRLPAIYGFHEFVEAGGLISYGADLRQTFKRAASYVDRILKGAKPSDLPVEETSRFELFINLKTAKALGLEVSRLLLFHANQVIA
jgi:putative tryptophan/tyrosine transport system substrate-binding protein